MKVVLAYSGGLDTSVILHWIKKTYDAEVVAYTGDVGQMDEDLDTVQERVNGEARLRIYKGGVQIEGRRSETHTLYDEAIATFEADDVYDQSDATGFIRLNALRLRTLAGRRIEEGE